MAHFQDTPPTIDDWLAMTESAAADLMSQDYGVPIEIFQKYPRLLKLANGFASVLLDWEGSYYRWAQRQGHHVSGVHFGIGKPGSLQRKFYDEQVLPLLTAERISIDRKARQQNVGSVTSSLHTSRRAP